MARLRLSGWGISDQDIGLQPHRLSSPLVFFWSMLIFLIIVGFLAAILYRQISNAFFANPGLNGLILAVLAVGILLVFNQVLRLRPEVSWVNSFRQGGDRMRSGRTPTLLAPMRVLLSRKQSMSLSTTSLRSILDSIATRLDESRDTSRYMIGLLVFLGLLGTFWGLLQTIGSINTVIQSLDPGSGDTNDVLQALKDGLASPLDGMGTAFSSSLFGLAGSLVLGFLDLQAGRAQNRFYTELENWLSTVTDPDFDVVAHDVSSGGESSEDIRRLSETVQSMPSRVAASTSDPQQRWPTWRRAFRVWSRICAMNSRCCETGSRRNRPSRARCAKRSTICPTRSAKWVRTRSPGP